GSIASILSFFYRVKPDFIFWEDLLSSYTPRIVIYIGVYTANERSIGAIP
ncbi:unnamed protein product, partial [marine sediment metagenome]